MSRTPSPAPASHPPSNTTSPSTLQHNYTIPRDSSSQTGSDTSTAPPSPSPSRPPKRKPHQEHIRAYFAQRPFRRWKFSSFASHCHAFPDYVWTHDKINNFWIKSLTQLRDEKTPLASVANIERLLKKHHGPSHNRHARKDDHYSVSVLSILCSFELRRVDADQLIPYLLLFRNVSGAARLLFTSTPLHIAVKPRCKGTHLYGEIA
ncbi:hypothetical protein BDZ91DRAFT_510433 [Kalaharituber pfeilii]|nr:hypothetical protein BDZ91DRAFT_510433 [Kalaharituber pfeilii]